MYRQLISILLLYVITFPLSAQWLGMNTPGLPRLADGSLDVNAPAPELNGRPDMTGLWLPVEPSGSLYDRSKIKPWALDAMDKHQSNFYMDDPRFHCLPSGPGTYPAGLSVGGMRRFVQHSEHMAILDPELNYRQIYMDGRELEASPLIQTWQGYSIGRWDGNTLVIESNGFNDKTWLTREGLPHTDQLTITERYSRPTFGRINVEITYDDPGTFTEPVKATFHMRYMANSTIMEAVCNESVTSRQHYDGEVSQAEEKMVVVPEEKLASYVGTYQGIWLGRLITTEFVFDADEFYLIRTPAYSDTGSNEASRRYELYAQSENAFDCICGLGFVFHTNDEGIVDVVDEVHVSGPWPFVRID